MPIEAQSYVALEPLAILLLKEDRLVAFINLRLANDPRILFDVLLDPLLLLLVNAAVGEQCDGLAALELEELIRGRVGEVCEIALPIYAAWRGSAAGQPRDMTFGI